VFSMEGMKLTGRDIPLALGLRAIEGDGGVWFVESSSGIVGLIRRDDGAKKPERRWQYVPEGGSIPVYFETFQHAVRWLRAESV